MTIQELELVSDLIAMDANAKTGRGELDVAEYDAMAYGAEIIAAARAAAATL